MLTNCVGASESISPSLSSVNTGSSQSSLPGGHMQYGAYSAGGHPHGHWPTSGHVSYQLNTPAQQVSPLGPNPFLNHHRPHMFSQPSNMSIPTIRSSQSPAAGGESLPAPPFDQVGATFPTSISTGGGGGAMSSAPGGLSGLPGLSQSSPMAVASSQLDSYAHARHQGYYSNTAASQQQPPQHHGYSNYTHQTSPNQGSPNSNGIMSRPMGPLSHQTSPGAMAPPTSFRYQQYPTLNNGGGPVMSNMHQPGAQMSMIAGMGGPHGYSHHPGMMYGHNQPSMQSERPFKCDQCVQSFSRNHDLKRHKRIHLAVKPFPCNYCSKSFSRKDALKVRVPRQIDDGEDR